jgi:hypothetical protein
MIRLLAICLVATACLAGPAGSETFRVVVVPGLELANLRALETRGAVGLLVPAAGPTTSGADARAALVRGAVSDSLRGERPSGTPLLTFETAATPPSSGPAIVLGLPSGGPQLNDSRYPIAVIGRGYKGILVSSSTRIPGLVSIADIAPTALGSKGALRSQSEAAPTAHILELDQRIRDNRVSGRAASILAALLIVLLAYLVPGSAVLGFAAALAANLVFGAAGISEPWVVILGFGLAVALGAPLLARVVRSATAVGLVLAAVVLAYLIALGVDGTAVSLAPLGPTQNSRFYGISNQLEAMLLVPALASAALLLPRFGPVAFVVVALVSLVAIAGDRFGADGGGAIVLGVGYATLAVTLARGGRRAFVAGFAAAAAVVALLVGIDAATGGSSHVTRAVRRGPVSLAGDLRDRATLSFDRAVIHWYTALIVCVALGTLLLLAARLLRAGVLNRDRAVALALAGATLVSLVVNDSPVEVAVAGLVGFVAVSMGTLAPDAPLRSPGHVLQRARARPRRGGLRWRGGGDTDS